MLRLAVSGKAWAILRTICGWMRRLVVVFSAEICGDRAIYSPHIMRRIDLLISA